MRSKQPSGLQRTIRLVGLGLTVWALVQELRKPKGERTWNGVVAGVVPYDFRVPTLARTRSRLWAPEDPRLITPQVFGVGWSLNAGRLVALLRGAVRRHAEPT
jgi:hypothetical protein